MHINHTLFFLFHFLSGDAGIKFNVDEASILFCFHLFFGNWMVNHLKVQTNKYAADLKKAKNANMDEEGTKILKNWKPVNLKEMKGFLLILIHMGVVRKSSISDYWSMELFIATPFAATILSRDRFKAILSMLHFNDNSSYIPIGQDNHDPLHKVRPVFEYLQTQFQEVYVPSKNVAVDEAMCAWRGRLRFKVYLKDKPNPWGIKFYQLCESGSGYTFRFEIYAADINVSNKPTDVVLRLIDPLLDKGYHVFTDNYYTCPALYEALIKRQTSCTGTVRSNRLGMPRDLAVEKLKTGEISFRRKGGLSAVKWSDKRDVMILTSAYDPSETVTTTSRNYPGSKNKPACVVGYTKNMCGVDQSDQLMSYLPLQRRTMKWSKKVFVHLLTLSIVQASILYNKACKSRNTTAKSLALPFFVKALGKALTEEYHQTEPRTPTPAKTVCAKPQPLQRLNHQLFHHLVSLPPTASKAKPRRDCKVCRDMAATVHVATVQAPRPRAKETYVMCKVCQVPLCIEPCFFIFHNKQNYIAHLSSTLQQQ